MDSISIMDFEVMENRMETKGIQRALDYASEHGGLTVKIPRGTFLTGTLNLGSASLYLEKGAVLMASGNPEDYYENGFVHNELRKCFSLLYSMGHDDIRVYGEGTIDLNGQAFYDRDHREVPDYGVEFSKEQILECTQKYTFRPTQPIFFYQCNHIKLEGIKIINAPCWTISFNDCEEIRITDLTIDNDLTIPNNDGMHFCECRNVFIRGCNIRSGDDCIALTSITDWNKPCENFVISDCILLSCSKTIVLGYIHSIIRNITVSNCVILDSHRGFCIMSSAGTGLVEHVLVENVRIETRVRAGNWWGNGEPICIIGRAHDYKGYLNPAPDRSLPVSVSDIHFRNISCSGENVIAIVGENHNIENVTIDGLSFEKKDSKNRYLKGDRVIDTSPAAEMAKLPEDRKEYWLHVSDSVNVRISNALISEFHGRKLETDISNCSGTEVKVI